METTVRVKAGKKKNTAFPKTCPLTVSLFLASFANSRFQVTYYFYFFFLPFPPIQYLHEVSAPSSRPASPHLRSLLINRFPSKLIARVLAHARDGLLRIYFAFYLPHDDFSLMRSIDNRSVLRVNVFFNKRTVM